MWLSSVKMYNQRRIYIICIRHTMFTICTWFFTFTTKHRVCVKGASILTSDPKNSTAPGPPPPEIPGSALNTWLTSHKTISKSMKTEWRRGFIIEFRTSLINIEIRNFLDRYDLTPLSKLYLNHIPNFFASRSYCNKIICSIVLNVPICIKLFKKHVIQSN